MMRRRYLALLTAMVMVFTSIPAGSLSLASDTDTKEAPAATPVVTSAPATELPGGGY